VNTKEHAGKQTQLAAGLTADCGQDYAATAAAAAAHAAILLASRKSATTAVQSVVRSFEQVHAYMSTVMHAQAYEHAVQQRRIRAAIC
jgi:hypothetical protein